MKNYNNRKCKKVIHKSCIEYSCITRNKMYLTSLSTPINQLLIKFKQRGTALFLKHPNFRVMQTYHRNDQLVLLTDGHFM
jgi:hypothetical protein